MKEIACNHIDARRRSRFADLGLSSFDHLGQIEHKPVEGCITFASSDRQMSGGSAQVCQSPKAGEVEGRHHFGRGQQPEPMHPLDERLFRLIGTEKMIEDSTFDIEGLLPARRAFSNRIFKMGPYGEQDVIGIKDVSRERSLAGPAQISAGYRLVFIPSSVPPQELKTHAGVQQSL